MDMRELGRSGLKITPIGLGCWQLQQGKGMTGGMWSVLDQETMDAIVSAALQGGVSWYDTAEAYGRGASERALASALRHSGVEPGRVVMATKWLPILKPARDLRRDIDERIACLTPYPVDLYQVHIPWSRLAGRGADARDGRAGARRQGARRRRQQLLREAHGQVRRSACRLRAFRWPRTRCASTCSIAPSRRTASSSRRASTASPSIAYSPLAQGVPTGRFHDDPPRVKALSRSRRCV